MRSWFRRLRRALDSRPSPRQPRPSHLTVEPLEERALLATGFLQTNLVSNMPGLAEFTDPQLVNPWGISLGPIWISDNQTGFSSIYSPAGVKAGAFPNGVSIPNAAKSPFAHATPTGSVLNTDPNKGDFNVTVPGASGPVTARSIFLFDSLDGTISGWNGTGTAAGIGVTVPGAIFTGLATGTDSNGNNLIYAADWAKGTVDVFNGSFTQVDKGSFIDRNVPKTFRPFNTQNINGDIWVSYAKFDRATGADTGTGGFVAEFNGDGVLMRTIKSQGWMNSPWGLTMAPSGFGDFGGDLLVGNFGDGTISAFDPHNGHFLGQLSDAAGNPVVNENLWGIRFGNPGSSTANTLFFTAGLIDAPQTIFGATGGLFGTLQALPHLNPRAALLPNLQNGLKQTFSTVPANGDNNPYGVAFVPADFKGQGTLQPGDLLVSNFSNKAGMQGAGSTIMRITPQGATSVFFQGAPGLGLTTALGVLKNGFVIVGSVPSTDGTAAGIQQGSLLILDANGNLVKTLSNADLLDSPWDLAINDKGNTAQVFVSNVLSGTVSRIDLKVPLGGKPKVQSETLIGSGFAWQPDGTALVLGPTGLAYDAKTDTLYVASTADNSIFAIKRAGKRTTDAGTGKDIFFGFGDPHLRGPVGMILAPNGDLIVANGDALPGTDNSELLEFTPDGTFVGEFQIDTGAGGAFGLAAMNDNGLLRFAAVNDNTNTVSIWSFDSHK
jgi:uncharacterized protein (TIGR03118 family)